MIAAELREFAAELEAGTVHAEGSPRWTDHMGARRTLSLDFTRPQYATEFDNCTQLRVQSSQDNAPRG